MAASSSSAVWSMPCVVPSRCRTAWWIATPGAARATDRVPRRHPCRGCRRGERRRSHGRRGQYRGAIGKPCQTRHDLSFRVSILAGQGTARSRGQRSRCAKPQEHCRTGAGLFARSRQAGSGQADQAYRTKAAFERRCRAGVPRRSLTDELTTSLSRIAGSFVIARTTAFTYKGKTIDAKQIGKDLGVHYVLEGSALSSGNSVRINAQLEHFPGRSNREGFPRRHESDSRSPLGQGGQS
jgi:hypothetical protein